MKVALRATAMTIGMRYCRAFPPRRVSAIAGGALAGAPEWCTPKGCQIEAGAYRATVCEMDCPSTIGRPLAPVPGHSVVCIANWGAARPPPVMAAVSANAGMTLGKHS
jgi:hypothetical protein